ncbi:MAG TPA: serine/threonine-protein kinase, partial [Polyangiaceae bacterium]|nr:serine/threonine-protein kinase [Polyangiaceae bacterium]
VATARRFPVDRALNVLVQLCDALSAVHAAGIVHRDLKPDNIFLVERRGQPDFVKVLDFGVCTFAASDAERLTASGDAVGTPLFMAPEQLEARHAVDERADIYALGTILFFMLTGEAPFSGSTLLALGSKICHAPPPSLASRGCEAPPELEAILQKALRKKPEARFQTCAELKSAIEEFLGPRSHVADTTLVSVPAPRIVLEESPDPHESTAIPRLAMDRSNLIFTAGLGLVAVAGAAAALVHFVRSDPFPKAIVDGRAGNTSVARIASLHASKAAASASAGVPSAAPSGPSGSPVTAAVGSSDLSSNALPAGPTAELAASSTSVADAAPAASAPAARMRPPASGALSSASGRSSKAERTAAEKRLPAAEESPVSAASTGSVPKATDETKSSAKGDTSSPRDVPPNPNGVSLNHGPKRGL